MHFIGDREFEDAFTNDIYLRVLHSSFAPASGEPEWQIDEIQQVRQTATKFSDDLCNLIRRRCRDHTIGKTELGVALTQHVRTDEIPQALRDCFEEARKRGGRATPVIGR